VGLPNFQLKRQVSCQSLAFFEPLAPILGFTLVVSEHGKRLVLLTHETRKQRLAFAGLIDSAVIHYHVEHNSNKLLLFLSHDKSSNHVQHKMS
jgi:hypothetical protein